jgi:HK97 family phage major capsid protein
MDGGLIELKNILDAQGRAWEEFKKANDARIADIEKKGVSDAVLTDKLAKINAALDGYKGEIDALAKKAFRPGAGADVDPDKEAHRKAFSAFMRKGTETGLLDLERKAITVGVLGDGGYALPEVIDTMISERLVDISPMRAVAEIVTVSTSDWKRIHNTRGMASGWVGETTARTATNTPTIVEIPAIMGEIYANPQASQQSLDDLAFNVEAWIADNIATEFAFQEGGAFVTGNGTNKPKGITAYTTAATADASRAFGTVEHVATGVSADFAASNKGDKLIDLVFKLKAGFRANASWMLAKAILGEVRQFKGSDNNYLFQPGLAAGTPATLLGYPIVEAEDMPVKAANSLSIAFGDFKRGYCIVDRVGIRSLRDPYSNKPNVGFYTTKRVGGMVTDSEAIKFLKFSVS